MNKSYRLIYNEITNTWVAVAETAKGRGKRTSGAVLLAAASIVLGVAPAFAAPPNPPAATQLPTGGKVVAGQAGITQSAATLSVNQTSNRAAIDWATFNVGSQAQVNFNQPSVSSVTLNRVLDANPSQIFGKISAPGQVFLTNPNGVYFAPGASVDVGGLVATTHSISNEDFMAGGNTFTRNGATGSVINEGNITASLGGYIALLAPEVRNQGVIVAQLGTVALAAGEAFELQFDGNNTLANIRVTPASIAALVDNGSAVQAPGGLIILSAQALNRLQGGVVNNSGSLEASGLVDNGGTIRLQASDRITHSGSIKVDAAAHSAGKGGVATLIANLSNHDSKVQIDGSFSARGGDLGGDGGFVETSGGRVQIGDAAHFDTSAAQGNTGTWLIDPVDFTIAASGGDISGTDLGTLLASNSVTIQTATGTNTATLRYGSSGTAGDINVNDVVSWSANKLTLNAQNNININANMNAAGSASLALVFGQGAAAVDNTSNIITASNAAVNLPAGTTNFTTLQGSNGVVKNYTVITSLGVAGSTTTTDLQGINGDLTGNYALGANIDASATSSWNSTAGFAPIGNVDPNRFSGSFDGLGHTINHLTINLPTTNNVGLFGYAMGTAVIRNVGLVGGGVTGQELVGGLLGFNYYGTISNSYATGTVVGTTRVGGLVGSNSAGVISNSYATGSVRGASYVGGLAGASSGSITNSYATGPVVGTTYVGGLAGSSSDRITNSNATGSVNGTEYVGGLVGKNFGIGSITNSDATGSVSGNDYVGGLVGRNDGGITYSYATGSVSGTEYVGGLAGTSSGSITDSYATGSVSGSIDVGGLVGNKNGGSISNSFYNSDVNPTLTGISGSADEAGTVWGMSSAAMSNTANFTGATGTNSPTDHRGNGHFNPNWTFTTTPGTSNAWVIVDVDGSLNNAGSTAGATFPMLASEYSTAINNAHQLQLMAMNLAGSYTLGANINAANTNTASALNDVWSTSGGFVPVGNPANQFTGSFDGLGHTISNLKINWPSTNYVGLFGIVGSSLAVIQNVGLVGGSVSGKDYVGGLAGQVIGTISNSYATGRVIGTTQVGGLVGNNSARSISNSYATGDVSGGEKVGGLVGYNYTGSITNSYATGHVIGTTDVGGLVGNKNAGSISNGFYDTITTRQTQGIGNQPDEVGKVTGLTTAQLLTQSSYSGWDFTNTWYMVDGSTRPFLRMEYSTSISNSHQLQLMGMNLAANYTLANNIDLATELANPSGMWSSSGFVPIGTYVWNDSTKAFTGSFDGLGHTISNLTINLPSTDYVGLFGASGSTAVIQNVGLVGGSVTGQQYVGGLVGASYGTISNSYNTGSVSGTGTDSRYVGGLVGASDGFNATITNSYATGGVSGNYGVGGLVGSLYLSTIANSYATGDVSGGEMVGGLVGTTMAGTITNSYATGHVTGTNNYVGGLVGWSDSTISNSYATGSVSGRDYVGGLGGLIGGGISNSYATGNVTGTNHVGGLAGNNTDFGIITNSYATGTVTGTTDVGGLVGLNDGDISNSYVTGSVAGLADVGGLVGNNWVGSITNSYASGSVIGTNFVGGLAGLNNGDINNSYATGNVSGQSRAGGLVGENPGAINYSYATGSVTGALQVGGLAGYSQGTISYSYSTGNVSTGDMVGGLVGRNYGTVSNSYWDITTSGQSVGIGGTGALQTGVTGLTNAQMQTASNFDGFFFTTNTGVTGNNWVMVDVDGSLNNAGLTPAAGATFPMLASEYSTTINNAHQLQLMAMAPAASYTLGSNINAANTNTASALNDVWSTSGGFVPVGNASTKFTGSFDGLGHTISNLTINLPSTDYVGLFGATGSAAVIQNVGLVDASVTGSDTVGGLVGWNAGGTISNSYATGSVTGTVRDVGGLAGWSSGSITNSYATASVSASGYVGGLEGVSSGTITNSYATGSVRGDVDYVGGLVGINNGAITRSYATGRVNGAHIVGGLVGWNNNGAIITTSYWDSSVNATGVGAGSSIGAIGLITTDMQIASKFTGFNFTSTPGANGNNWVMIDVDGSLNNAGSTAGATFPMLASEYSTTINNAHQLQLMAMAPAASYTLGANINAANTGSSSADVWSTSGGFVPVGNLANPFTGSFDGLGHTISNLKINWPSTDYVGLFGMVGSSLAVVQNVGLVGVSVSGNYEVGSLVGESFGSIANSYATGSVSGNDGVGGLVGYTDGSTSNSYATGTVVGTTYVGGLVGASTGSITNSYATGSVTGTGMWVGGLVGVNSSAISNSYATGTVVGTAYVGGLVGGNSSAISNSYATGSVSGNDGVGGLVGYNDGSTSNSYATGTVNGKDYVGGLVGQNDGYIDNSYAMGPVTGTDAWVGGLVGYNINGNISKSYSTGLVTGSDTVGGLVGLNDGEVSKSFWDKETSGQPTSAGGSGRLSTADMKTQANFTSATTANGSVNPGWDFSTIWKIEASKNNGYPYLAWQSFTPAYLRLITGSSTYGDTPGLSYALYTASSGGTVVSNASPSGSVIWSAPLSNTSGAGSYAEHYLSGISLGNSAYSLSAGSDVNWTIDPRSITVTAGSASRIYGSVNPVVSAFSASGLVNGDAISSVTNTIAGSASASANAGTRHAITPSAAVFGSGAAGNYDISYANGTLTIGKAHLTVSADPLSRIYGAANPSFTETISGFVNGEVLATSGVTGTATGSSTASATTGAGSATITASSTGLSAANYDFTNLLNGTLTISQRPITVTADGKSKTYGDANPALTYTVAADGVGSSRGLVNGDTLSGAPSTAATGSSSVGSYTISASALSNGNYLITANNGTLTISQRPITVTADGKSKTYGDANPALTYTVAADGVGSSRGLVNGDTLSGAPSTAATGSSSVGSYTIDASALTNGNYLITAHDGTLTINKANLTVTASNASKTYDGLAFSGGSGVSYSGFVLQETPSVLGGSLAYAGSAQNATNAGTFTITPQGLTAGNYTLSFVDGALTINKAHLTVTANDASRIVGQANPVFTATLSGFVNNETPLGAGIGGSAALSTLANAATPASKLPITVAQGSLAARNYDFTVFKDGTLTVKDLFVPPPPTAWRRDLPPASDGVGDEDEDGNDEDTLSSLDSHVVP